MRQADSTIRGYLYQFNKSIYEILLAKEDESITLEGVIEDIDIESPSGTTTIQCKYHEDKKFQMSNVVVPILDMLCNFCESVCVGKSVSYILYAYFVENVDKIDMDSFLKFVQSTTDQDILCKYYHRIYSIPDSKIVNIANKARKSSAEKEKLITYYQSNRGTLSMRVNIIEFWKAFTYIKAKKFDVLKEEIIQNLSSITDIETVRSLYYPNALSLVASLSSKRSAQERTITKKQLISFLTEQKAILINKWSLVAFDRKQLLQAKKADLKGLFSYNFNVRAFIFTDQFLDKSGSNIIPFIREYLNKYFKKPKLQKPPIFVFGDNHFELMQKTLIELYNYQKPVNSGLIGNVFVQDSFISNRSCPPDFVCKMTLLQNVDVGILEKCEVDQLYILGKCERPLKSVNYRTEELDIYDIDTIRYLALTTTLEVK